MIINGNKIAQEFLDEIKQKIEMLGTKRAPCLAFILVGDHPASHLYVKLKIRACDRVGIKTKGFNFKSNVTQNELIELLNTLNKDPNVDGILVQMPLPPHILDQQIIEAIDPKKDVDGFHPLNMGRLLLGHTPYFVPCTPLGIHKLLLKSGISTSHKHVVIMGRSNIVGKPLAALLMQKNKEANATVTVVHSHTQDLEKITLSADILISAMGSPYFVKASMVKERAVVVDVGINRLHGRVVGDVDLNHVRPVASYITPVPGGVGPMTIAMLLSNTFRSYQLREELA